jgi:hypothetical protein
MDCFGIIFGIKKLESRVFLDFKKLNLILFEVGTVNLKII